MLHGDIKNVWCFQRAPNFTIVSLYSRNKLVMKFNLDGKHSSLIPQHLDVAAVIDKTFYVIETQLRSSSISNYFSSFTGILDTV